MRIVLNGESRELPDAYSVASLLAQLQIKTDGVAVEVNLNIVDRSAFETTRLQDGDRVEVIGFIGGGGGNKESVLADSRPREKDASRRVRGRVGVMAGVIRRNPEKLPRRP